MVHLRFLLYLLALVSGVVAITLTTGYYRRYKKPTIRLYGLFLVSLAVVLVSFLLGAYGEATGLSREFEPVVWFLSGAGGLFFFYLAPFFYHALLGISQPSTVTRLYVGLDVVATGLAITDAISPQLLWTDLTLALLLFGMIAYGLVLLLVRLGRVSEPRLRRALIVFFTLTVVFLPLMFVDSLEASLPDAGILTANVWQPLYFLILTALSVLFARRYLNRPAFATEDGALTEHFRLIYGISAREAEIIERLVAGDATKDIAERLFISPKTVENHVYNIYKKVNVRNRLQLFALLNANRGETGTRGESGSRG